MKKILALVLVLVFAFSSVSFAAVSSSRTRSSSPSISTPSTPKSAPSQQTSPSTQGSTYTPSASANSYSDKAPASQVKPGVQTPQQQNNGGFWRNAGMFGGGMLLGSMLSSMFGFGHMGAMSSIFGMIFNIIILAGIFMGIRYLWSRFRNKKDM